jgi:hypothetical protein
MFDSRIGYGMRISLIDTDGFIVIRSSDLLSGNIGYHECGLNLSLSFIEKIILNIWFISQILLSNQLVYSR